MDIWQRIFGRLAKGDERSRKPSTKLRQLISDRSRGSKPIKKRRTGSSQSFKTLGVDVRRATRNFLNSMVSDMGNGTVLEHDDSVEARFKYGNRPTRVIFESFGKHVIVEMKAPFDEFTLALSHDPFNDERELPYGCEDVHSGIFLDGNDLLKERTQNLLREIPEGYRRKLYEFIKNERVERISISDTFAITFRDPVAWRAIRGWRDKIMRALRLMDEGMEVLGAMLDEARKEEVHNRRAAPMVCPSCGSEIVATPDGLCPECGAPLFVRD